MAVRHGAGERAVKGEMFGSSVTVYRYEGGGWSRRVIGGVFLRRTAQMRALDGGMREYSPLLRMTVQGETCPAQVGDLIVLGMRPEVNSAQEMAALRENGECYAVARVEDNTAQPRLKHWRIEAE